MLLSKVCPTNPNLTRGRVRAESLGAARSLLLLIVMFAAATAAWPAHHLPHFSVQCAVTATAARYAAW